MKWFTKHRFFIVSASFSNGGEIDFACWRKGCFPSRYSIEKWIKDTLSIKHNVEVKTINIRNIIEISKQDYRDYTSQELQGSTLADYPFKT